MASGWPPERFTPSLPLRFPSARRRQSSAAARWPLGSVPTATTRRPRLYKGGSVLVEVRAARADPLTTHAHKLKSKFVSVRGSDPATYQFAQTSAVSQHVHVSTAVRKKPSPPH